MSEQLSEKFTLQQIVSGPAGPNLKEVEKDVIAEMSLKVIINGDEYASLLCLNQCQEELALGFLYSEGVIDSFEDIAEIRYHERLSAVIMRLKDGVDIQHQESLRSVTSGCGKCFTYINPLKQDKYPVLPDTEPYALSQVLEMMHKFETSSELTQSIGGVHSVLYHSPGFSVLNEDIGRHNCVDKITGILLKNGQLAYTHTGIMCISGRVSSEIMTKVVRLQIPILVSRSTPTAAAVRLARQYHVTLLGYVRGGSGFVYSSPERLK